MICAFGLSAKSVIVSHAVGQKSIQRFTARICERHQKQFSLWHPGTTGRSTQIRRSSSFESSRAKD